MGELVSKHGPSAVGRRVVLVALEDDVGADGVGVCVDRLRGFMGGAVVVHPDIAEVVAEPGLHVGAGVLVERAPARGDDVVDGRTLLLDHRGDAAVADSALEPEQARATQDVASPLDRGARHPVGDRRLDPRGLGAQGGFFRVIAVVAHGEVLPTMRCLQHRTRSRCRGVPDSPGFAQRELPDRAATQRSREVGDEPPSIDR